MRLIVIVVLMLTAHGAFGNQEEGPFVYDDHGRRDPLWPLVSPAGVILNYETEFLITDLVLEGIMAGAGKENVAVINGHILKTGNMIGQFTVERVNENSVVLKKGNLKYELKLKKEE